MDEPLAKRAKVQKTLEGFYPRADHGEEGINYMTKRHKFVKMTRNQLVFGVHVSYFIKSM